MRFLGFFTVAAFLVLGLATGHAAAQGVILPALGAVPSAHEPPRASAAWQGTARGVQVTLAMLERSGLAMVPFACPEAYADPSITCRRILSVDQQHILLFQSSNSGQLIDVIASQRTDIRAFF